MAQSYVLGIDQGGSGSRAIVLDTAGAIVGYGYQPVSRIYPQPGWVEQDPQATAESVRAAIAAAVEQAGCAAAAIVGCGITTQRDTVFAWDAASGQPIGNAITWQDLRTEPLVAEVAGWPHASERRERLAHSSARPAVRPRARLFAHARHDRVRLPAQAALGRMD